jgi:limonene-1,2-epoxide hydrolase
MQVNEHDINPKEIVSGFLEALQRKDFKSARNYVSDNVTYVSPLNSLNGAEPYFKYVEHLKYYNP